MERAKALDKCGRENFRDNVRRHFRRTDDEGFTGRDSDHEEAEKQMRLLRPQQALNRRQFEQRKFVVKETQWRMKRER
jgi:hypothetical protein